MASRRPHLTSHGESSVDHGSRLQDKYHRMLETGRRQVSCPSGVRRCPDGSRVIWLNQLINTPFDLTQDPPIDDNTDDNDDIVYVNAIGSWKGNAFVVGQHHGVLKLGSIILEAPNGRSQGFVAQYSSNGTVINAFPIWLADGSRDNQEYVRIDFDNHNNLYIVQSLAGETTLPDKVVLNETEGLHVLFKYTTNGDLVWFLQIKGIEGHEYGVTVAGDGTSFIAGYYVGSVRIGPPGSIQVSTLLAENFFLSRISSVGEGVWVKTAFGTGRVRSADVSLDSKGRLVVAGTFDKSISIDGVELVNTTAQNNGWVGRFDTDGKLLSLIDPQHVPDPSPVNTGSNNLLTLSGVSSDDQGNSYVAGQFLGTFRFGGTVLTSNDPAVCVARLDDSGAWSWARQINVFLPRRHDPYPRISTSGDGNSYVTTFSQNEVTVGQNPESPSLSQFSGAIDLTILKFNSTGNLQWGTSFSGVITNPSVSASTDTQNNVFTIGNRCLDEQQVDGLVARLKD